MKQLKLFTWGHIKIDNDNFMIFAMAYDENEAKKSILDNMKTEATRNYFANYMFQNKCAVYDEPTHFILKVGNQLIT
jgi:hypothetical protein